MQSVKTFYHVDGGYNRIGSWLRWTKTSSTKYSVIIDRVPEWTELQFFGAVVDDFGNLVSVGYLN